MDLIITKVTEMLLLRRRGALIVKSALAGRRDFFSGITRAHAGPLEGAGQFRR